MHDKCSNKWNNDGKEYYNSHRKGHKMRLVYTSLVTVYFMANEYSNDEEFHSKNFNKIVQSIMRRTYDSTHNGNILVPEALPVLNSVMRFEIMREKK